MAGSGAEVFLSGRIIRPEPRRVISPSIVARLNWVSLIASGLVKCFFNNESAASMSLGVSPSINCRAVGLGAVCTVALAAGAGEAAAGGLFVAGEGAAEAVGVGDCADAFAANATAIRAAAKC